MTRAARITTTEVVDGLAPRLRARLAPHEVVLALDLQSATDLAAPHLAEALETVLLVLSEYPAPPRPFVVRTRDREGGDSEVVVEGVDLPESFPRVGPFADLWSFAVAFLSDFHRARLAEGGDRVLLLVPHARRGASRRRRD